ncbi:MAG: cysteine desulfurase family protein [Thiohalomonadaceae bacterium]
MIYLDHNATTPLDPRVLEAMLPWLQDRYGNPSSRHALGRQAKAALELAREQVAALVNAHPSQVIFTSGGTEANNLALKGRAMAPGRLQVSAIEHASLLGPARAMQREGWQLDRLPVDSQGMLDIEAAVASLNDETRLVSLMWANNETGAIQPVAAMAECCRSRGIVMHSDAVQAAGKIPVDFASSGVQLLSLSAHKIYGPKGVGALVVDKSLELLPLLDGGGQERNRRGGTENIPAIVGFGLAAELARLELPQRSLQLEHLRGRLEQQLAQQLPQAVIFSSGIARLPNTVFLAIPGLDGETLIMAMDREGIALSSGSACGSAQNEPSPVLRAMGVATELAQGAIRISLGKDNTEQDIDRLVAGLCTQVQTLQGMAAATAW